MNARIVKFVLRDLGILPEILPQGLRYFNALYYGSKEPYPEARVRPDHLARTSYGGDVDIADKPIGAGSNVGQPISTWRAVS